MFVGNIGLGRGRDVREGDGLWPHYVWGEEAENANGIGIGSEGVVRGM